MKRVIGVMIGSDSDLPQCEKGVRFLLEAEKEGKVLLSVFITNSIHRNTSVSLGNADTFSAEDFCDDRVIRNGGNEFRKVNVWIIGAGMANHLTGTIDAFLRYALKNDQVPVIGVAFRGKTSEDTRAASSSIRYVPGTKVIFSDFIGSEGFLKACKFAVNGSLPEITLGEPKSPRVRTFQEALGEIERKKGEGK